MIKKFFKQLFCKHDWDDISKFYSKYSLMCSKCGKVK